ncbi:MAG: histidine phosphatase family protein [Acidimicrobiia bacterium]
MRHGATEWSQAWRHTGRTDLALLDVGREQAKALRPHLAHWTFAAIFVSPLKRALDTAELAGFGARAVIDDDLIEWDYGDAEGRTSKEIRVERPGWSIWKEGPVGGETVDDVGRRADRVIERALSTEGDTLLVAHGHLLRILTARWLELEPKAGRLFRLDPATISVLGWEHDYRTLNAWNRFGAGGEGGN